jgi:hypothetical protein
MVDNPRDWSITIRFDVIPGRVDGGGAPEAGV